MGGGEVKVATVDVEGGDNMATLPVSRSHTAGSTDSAEKNNAANKEMELKNVMPQPLQRVCYTFKPNPNKHSFMPAKITVQGTYQTNPITGPIELW